MTTVLIIDAILLVDELTAAFSNAVLTFKLRRAMRIAKLLRKAKQRLQRRRNKIYE